jgi:hypothetical protein
MSRALLPLTLHRPPPRRGSFRDARGRRFYWDWALDIPAVFRGTVEAWLFWAFTVIAPIIAFFNPELGKLLQLEEFPRGYALAPLLVALIYGLMRANYRRFQVLEAAVGVARARELSQASVDALARLKVDGVHLLGEQVTGLEVNAWAQRMRNWRDSVAALLRDKFTEAEALRFQYLGVLPSVDFEHARDQHHRGLLRVLHRHLEILDEIITSNTMRLRLTSG